MLIDLVNTILGITALVLAILVMTKKCNEGYDDWMGVGAGMDYPLFGISKK